jgi:hypothetical protein
MLQQYQCSVQTETIDTLDTRNIVKARIQRRIKWLRHPDPKKPKTPNYYAFINFILSTRTLITPILFIEKMDNAKKTWLVIDGNNRLNAIMTFLKQPLCIFDTLIPKEWSANTQTLVTILKMQSYTVLCNRDYNKTIRHLLYASYTDYSDSDVGEILLRKLTQKGIQLDKAITLKYVLQKCSRLLTNTAVPKAGLADHIFTKVKEAGVETNGTTLSVHIFLNVISELEANVTTLFETVEKQSDDYYDYILSDVVDSKTLKDMEKQFDVLINTLDKYKFNDIKLVYFLFENISHSELCNLYQSVNQVGVQLTQQEILASSTAHMIYTIQDIPTYYNQIHEKIDAYYEDTSNRECLELEEHTEMHTSLNLFEILLGFQFVLKEKYSHHISFSTTENCQLALIFQIFDYFHRTDVSAQNSFEQKPSSERLTLFLDKVWNVFEKLHTIYESFHLFDAHKKNAPKLSLMTTNLIFVIMGLMESDTDKSIFSHVKALMIYDLVCRELPTAALETALKDQNPMKYVPHGKHKPSTVHKIIKHGIRDVFPLPDRKEYKDLFNKVISHSTKTYTVDSKPKCRRSTLSVTHSIILSLYYNAKVPQGVFEKDDVTQCDHIIPWSSTWEGEIDLDRLGNCMYIDPETNNSKGNRMIDDAFIKKHQLEYHLYPSGVRMSNIVDGDQYIECDEYEKWCTEREGKLIYEAIEHVNKTIKKQKRKI